MLGTSMITLMPRSFPQFVGMRHITKTTTFTVHALLAQARPTMPCICLVIELHYFGAKKALYEDFWEFGSLALEHCTYWVSVSEPHTVSMQNSLSVCPSRTSCRIYAYYCIYARDSFMCT